MTDLLRHPLWQGDSLGSPLPDTEHGVSVSLPLWRHVIGYEEKDPEVVSKFRSGYPRFCCPPVVSALFTEATKRHARKGEAALVFPRAIHAERCVAYVMDRSALEPDQCRVVEFDSTHPLGVALFPEAMMPLARQYWRFCGEVVSTRQAADALGLSRDSSTKADGQAAHRTLRQRLSQLTGQSTDDVFLFPSGMAATFAVLRMLQQLFSHRRTIQLDFPYVDVLKVQQQYGRGAVFFPVMDEGAYAALKERLKSEPIAGIFTEAPANPLLRCVNYERVKAMAGDVPLVIDDTVGTVVQLDAFRYADVVTTSLTKAFSGKGDLMAGSVVINGASTHAAAFRKFMRGHADHQLWHGDAVALELNSRDFPERVQQACKTSAWLYEKLITHPKIGRVWHTKNEGGAGHQQLQRHPDAQASLFSFTLKEMEKTPAFYDALRVCKGPSLGTNFTLACPYTLLAHYDELPWAESCGVPRDLIRVSTGLEEPEDLLARFEQALAL
ncbi:MAG: PLP-dependent transferase [Verrucomicrobiaceae bacterium]|nr:PLP-dependent transferase [Verrucomicrobiaceae bacterium]